MTESFAELFEQSQHALSKLKPGAIVSGVIVEIRSDVIVVNAGLKSEGVIDIEQFRTEAGDIDVKVGDTVKVALEYLENGFGETVLSREKAKRALVWDELETSMDAGEIVTGRISGKVKGGFTVDIRDVRAFLPGSLVDVRPVRDPGYLEGKELEFKIIKLDRNATTWWFPAVRLLKVKTASSANKCLSACRKVRSLPVWSRTSLITAHSLTWAVSMVCCTSPTWRGNASVIRLKWLMSAKNCKSAYSSMTANVTVSALA